MTMPALMRRAGMVMPVVIVVVRIAVRSVVRVVV